MIHHILGVSGQFVSIEGGVQGRSWSGEQGAREREENEKGNEGFEGLHSFTAEIQ